MADYLRAAVAVIDGCLQARTEKLLAALGRPAIADWRHADTGVMQNPPTVWVTPLRNAIEEEGQGITQSGQVMVIIGLTGTDPEDLVAAAMDYVAAVTDAIESMAEWTDNIRHVHPGQQDYSARFRRGAGFAIFPTVVLTVETTEAPVASF
jgi:hypothetical protein